jgi:hypothetical protein
LQREQARALAGGASGPLFTGFEHISRISDSKTGSKWTKLVENP